MSLGLRNWPYPHLQENQLPQTHSYSGTKSEKNLILPHPSWGDDKRNQAHLGGAVGKYIHSFWTIWRSLVRRIESLWAQRDGRSSPVVFTWDTLCLSFLSQEICPQKGPHDRMWKGCARLWDDSGKVQADNASCKAESWSLKHLLSGKRAEVLRSKCFGLKTFKHLKCPLGNSQPGPAGDSFRRDVGGGPEACSVCILHVCLSCVWGRTFIRSFICSTCGYSVWCCTGSWGHMLKERHGPCCHEAHKEVPKFQNPGISNYWRDLKDNNFL